jgi:hypothetical protein
MLKKAVLGMVFLTAFFSTVQYLKNSDSSVASLRWGAGVEVAHARGK